MLVSQIIGQAMQLLNYTDGSGKVGGPGSYAVTARGLSAVQQIYRDLYFALWPHVEERGGGITVGDTPRPTPNPDRPPPPPDPAVRPYFHDLFSPNDIVPLPDRLVADVMPYGVAMLLAQGESDADNQAVFARIYSQKRAALTHTDSRVNRLP